MRWLRDFFRERDPLIKVAAGLSEPEAQMWRELLQNNGVPTLVKNMNFLSVTREFGSMPGDCDLFVKERDVERAMDIVGPMLQPGQLPLPPRRRAEDRRP